MTRRSSMARFNEILAPEPAEVGECAYCQREILEGDEACETVDDELIHRDCWRDYSDIRYLNAWGVINSEGELN